jgi:Fe2+ or Zn2+ uptake regulation protein
VILNSTATLPAVMPDLHLTVASRLRESRERYTQNRRSLVQLLGDASQPLAIRDILDAGGGLAQSSVYRNLVVLERAGVVRRLQGPDEFARYELEEDLTHHHHHVVCSSCGAVRDFTTSSGLERTLRRVVDEASRQTGYALDRHTLDVFGLCKNCA